MDFDFRKDRGARIKRWIPALEEYIRRHYVEERNANAAPPASGSGAAGMAAAAGAPSAPAGPYAAMAGANRADANLAADKAAGVASAMQFFGQAPAEKSEEEKKPRRFMKALGIAESKKAFSRESAPAPRKKIECEPLDAEQSAPGKKSWDEESAGFWSDEREELAFEDDLAPYFEADVASDIEARESALENRMKHLSDTYQQYLFYLIESKGMTNAEVYKRALVDKKVFAKIKGNPDYHPAKMTALQLCVGAKLNLDETRDLLARAGYALSPCNKTDVIFSFFIENEIYDMIDIDIQLEMHGQACIVV
ncbi:MAG: hypothetical protein J5546_03560 [Lachnospiraceae bacterium]|nr:hypothetical protein [Lachnospiraceae bacterium]